MIYNLYELQIDIPILRFCQLLQKVWLTNLRTSGKAVRQ